MILQVNFLNKLVESVSFKNGHHHYIKHVLQQGEKVHATTKSVTPKYPVKICSISSRGVSEETCVYRWQDVNESNYITKAEDLVESPAKEIIYNIPERGSRPLSVGDVYVFPDYNGTTPLGSDLTMLGKIRRVDAKIEFSANERDDLASGAKRKPIVLDNYYEIVIYTMPKNPDASQDIKKNIITYYIAALNEPGLHSFNDQAGWIQLGKDQGCTVPFTELVSGHTVNDLLDRFGDPHAKRHESFNKETLRNQILEGLRKRNRY